MLDGMGREEMRAADADRQAVADRLRAALDEGRLDLHEYDERLQRAYAAKTYGDLDGLLTDLPVTAPGPVPAARAEPSDHVVVPWLLHVWSGWVPAVAVTTAIWAVTSVSAGQLLYFWPIWVAGPWGAVLLWRTIGGLATGQPGKIAEACERAELGKQSKRGREAREAEPTVPGLPPPATPARSEATGDEALG
jgi:Domain of unknown function (DUF1707)